MSPDSATLAMSAAADPVEWITATMKRNAPVLVFHPDEEYFTYDVPDFLNAVQLCDAASGKVIAQPPLTQANLPSGKPSEGTFLQIPDNRDSLKYGDLAKTVVYVHALQWQHGDSAGFDFQYFFFYAYNGTASLIIRFPGLPENDIPIPVGNHQGDWESIIVRTDTNGNVIAIYCNQHSDGTWYLPNQIRWTPDGHPIIYVAKSGHPSYVAPGHYPTPGGDFTVDVLGYDIGGQLDNVAADGQTLATADRLELLAVSFVPGVEVPVPWWLNYLGRYGRIVYTKQDLENVTDVLTTILNVVIPIRSIAETVAGKIASKVIDILGELKPDGPEPPRAKGWWDTIRQDGPWRTSNYRWSGDVRISSLPGNIRPQSNYGPSLCRYNGRLWMVYKGAHSNTLYWAAYDGARWSGNQPIRMAGGDPESNYTPAIAAYGGRLYMVYKGAHSNALYSAWFDGSAWHGNQPIRMAGGDPLSNYCPAMVEYDGALWIVYKGAHSNTLYSARFDGMQWQGNRPISSDHGGPESNYTPGLAVYSGRIWMVYKGAHSNTLYSCSFDGVQWRGNQPISTSNGTPKSDREPWAGVADGQLVLVYKGADSTNLYWTVQDAGTWFGNLRIGQTSPIAPRSDQTGALAWWGDGLTMVYKADNGDDIYQSLYLPKTAAAQEGRN